MVTITVNSKQVTDQLNKLVAALKDPSPAFRDIADLELAQTKSRFLRQVDPDGKKWAEPFTIRRGGPGAVNTQYNNPWAYVKASNYHAAPPGYRFFDSSRGDKILRDTSTLFNSISRAYGKDYAVVGTNVEYAKKHQYGEGVKERPFLGINKTTIENVRSIFLKYMEGLK